MKYMSIMDLVIHFASTNRINSSTTRHNDAITNLTNVQVVILHVVAVHLAVEGASALAEVGVLSVVQLIDHLQLVDVDEVVHDVDFGEVNGLAGESSLPGHGVVVELHTHIDSGSTFPVVFTVRSVE